MFSLCVLAKALERVAAVRLSDHLARNNFHEVSQSAYRPYHSTETALMDSQQKLISYLSIGRQSWFFA